MTRPAPRPLATVTRHPSAAQQAQALVPLTHYTAQCAAIRTAAELVREVRTRKAAQQHTVPMAHFNHLVARLDALAALLKEET
jgi:hypothetical protein